MRPEREERDSMTTAIFVPPFHDPALSRVRVVYSFSVRCAQKRKGETMAAFDRFKIGRLYVLLTILAAVRTDLIPVGR